MCCSLMAGGLACCSECVGIAACNPALCSSCITGAVACIPVCTPTPGSGTCICSNTSTACSAFCIADLPYAGQDANGNDIYQNPDGSLRYADGSPATRGDIAYNCGACQGTPCSPHTCGTTCQPPKAGACNKPSSGAPMGGGSGGGSAKPSGGASNPKCNLASKLSQAMNRFGASITSLFAGSKRTATGNVLPGQAVPKTVTGISSNSFLLVIVIVGVLLLVLAFGHKPVPD